MISLVYIKSISPSADESALIASLEGVVRQRTAKFWEGETEPAERVYAASEAIREAYQRAGVQAFDIEGKAETPVAPVPVQDSDSWQVVSVGGGWFDVKRGEETGNEKSLRKAAAEALARKLNG